MTTVQTTPQPLVDTEWLAAHLADPDVCVVEIDVSPKAYTAGHIDGAVLWNVYADVLQPDYRIVERARFAELLSRSGIRPETTVVVYGYAASLGFWLLTYYGHPRVSLLDGSRAAWLAEQRPVTNEVPQPASSGYDELDFGELQDPIRARRDQVLRAIDDPAVRLMDVRSIPEYTGARFWPSLPPEGDQRGGHMPGAVLVPIEDTWAADGRFKPVAELRRYYEGHGFASDGNIITYCAVGGRASQAWFVLTRLLGYPSVRVYDGSWVEWGMLPDVPVAR